MMKKSLLFILIASCLNVHSQQLESTKVKKDDSRIINTKIMKFKDSLNTWFSRNEIIGGEMLIIKDKKTILHEVVGWKDLEDKETYLKNTICRIRSMTKPFLTMSILQLVDQKKMSLDDKVAKHVLSFNNEKSKLITIRNLLTHTSGIENADYANYVGHITNYKSLKNYVDIIGETGPIYKPNSQFKYSDLNSSVLAHLITIISGIKVEDYIKTNIIKPLEMSNTFSSIGINNPKRKEFSSTYVLNSNSFVKYWDNLDEEQYSFFRGSGGLYSTPIDYAKFVSLWLDYGISDDKTYISKKLVKETFTPSKFFKDYGLHWSLYNYENTDTSKNLPVFHHGGSDGTFAIAIPNKNIIAIYFTQSRGSIVLRKFVRMILKEFAS